MKLCQTLFLLASAVASTEARAAPRTALAKPYSAAGKPSFSSQQQISNSNTHEQTADDYSPSHQQSSTSTSTSALSRGGDAKSRTLSLPFAVACGVILSFNSGFVNGCCLRGAYCGMKQAVSAVTGAWTTSAVGMAEGNRAFAWLQLRMLASYMTGSALGGFSNPFPVAFTLAPMTGPVFLVAAACLHGASVLAGKHVQDGATSATSLWVFFLAAIACGINNSVSSSHTGNLIRSAHFSGTTSDMGTYVGQMLGGNTANLQRLKIFMALGTAFWTGGFISVSISDRFAHTALAFSAALMAMLGIGAIIKV
jgi:hypothetical protein